MEDTKRLDKSDKIKIHPKENANFITNLFFCWQLRIFFKGWRNKLSDGDIYLPLKECDSKRLGDLLESYWFEETQRKRPSLCRALRRLFGFECLCYGILFAPVEIASTILRSYFLIELLGYFKVKKDVSREEAYFYALILCLLPLLRMLFYHWTAMQLNILGMKARIACSALIYRRCLKLNTKDLEKISVGRIVNLLSNDVGRFDNALTFIHFLWIAPLEFFVAIFYLKVTLGATALEGITVVIAFFLVQLFIIKKSSAGRMKVAVKTDHRIRLISDVISGIQTIKMYAWEESFARLVKAARKLEMKEVVAVNIIRLLNFSVKLFVSRFCIYLSVLIMVLRNVPLSPQYVFALVSIYGTLRVTMTVILPNALFFFTETKISSERVENFLLYDFQQMCENNTISCHTENIYLEKIGVKLSDKDILTNINFSASSGELVGIVGTTGSGKSTILQVILKDLKPSEGYFAVKGTISYACQEPWIFPASIKKNIIFGETFDGTKYLKVIKVCCLEHDLAILPHGDETLVGERGVMLSGGQKARINLARAVYRDADNYLLDDPLSAVDLPVAKKIYDECISDYLKNKCVVLVTHQVHFLQNAKKIYIVEGGEIVENGKYQDLVTLKTFIKDTNRQKTTEKSDANTLQTHEKQKAVQEIKSSKSDLKVYQTYCLAAGHWSFTVLVFVLFLMVQLTGSCVDYFLTIWINLEEGVVNYPTKIIQFLNTHNCLIIYTVLQGVLLLITVVTLMVLVIYCTKASKILHDKILFKILHTTLTFFNHHSSGRILNRFSKEISCVDELLPLTLANVLILFGMLLSCVTIILVANYWLVFPTICLCIILTVYTKALQPTNQNIKRTEAAARSEIFGHVTASIQGLTTIKASNAQEILSQEFDHHQNINSSSFYLYTTMYAAFGFWAEVICVIYIYLVVFNFFLFESAAGNVGLIVTQLTAMLGVFQFGVKIISDLFTNMVSVERIVDYTELPSEPDEGLNIVPETWPEVGSISFKNVSLQYPLTNTKVIKNISFDVKPGEKIGIVGRTGAGKSSLTSILFRLYPFEGIISIDGMDTTSVSLKALRSKIATILQEPVLFLGTIRKNLDPFDEFTDHQLWNVLEKFHVKSTIENLSLSLESEVSEGGSNFSAGQRQLLCLARAMLRNCKIIVLDEATASLDHRTDELIQSTVRRNFQNCTVLTIAHRLHTVIDSDKILVINDGMIVEFDHPHNLLQNPKGFFYNCVEKSGEEGSRSLKEVAEKKIADDMKSP